MEKQTTSVGRRKEAVTRIFVTKGKGAITVNDKDYKVYFPLVYLQNQVERPLKTIEATDKFDVKWDPLESTCRHASLSIL